jgi:hypothetical protein
MEPQILSLDAYLQRDPEWRHAVERIDSEFITVSAESAKRITQYFGHERDRTPMATRAAWRSLESHMFAFFRHLDGVGVSPIVGRVAPEHFRNFSFRDAYDFRSIEEDLVAEIEIPAEAWERFWYTIDENRSAFLERVQSSAQFRFRSLLPLMREFFAEEPASFEPLSPFNWSKGFLGGLATTLGIVDFGAAPLSAGVSVGSAVVAGICVFYTEGKT